MISRKVLLSAGLLAVIAAGCGHSYKDDRPDPGKLTDGDVGLQSSDLLAATDQMVQSLMSLPSLNSSPRQWTLVVDHFQDMTRDHLLDTNYDIFTEDLKSAISEKGQGRIAVIENRAQFHDLRDRELEGNAPDPFQQGGGPGGQPAPQAMNPDYELYGKALDMPNRNTDFYLLEYNITNLRTRQIEWTRTYKVKTSR